MKYFFAVVYWDSVYTANLLYNEIDRLEFELSNLRMDLRFIPESLIEFPYPPKEVWYEVPDEYECNFFVNRAIGHTKVKLTWDQEESKANKNHQKEVQWWSNRTARSERLSRKFRWRRVWWSWRSK